MYNVCTIMYTHIRSQASDWNCCVKRLFVCTTVHIPYSQRDSDREIEIVGDRESDREGKIERERGRERETVVISFLR